jgi:hypothetical protein
VAAVVAFVVAFVVAAVVFADVLWVVGLVHADSIPTIIRMASNAGMNLLFIIVPTLSHFFKIKYI